MIFFGIFRHHFNEVQHPLVINRLWCITGLSILASACATPEPSPHALHGSLVRVAINATQGVGRSDQSDHDLRGLEDQLTQVQLDLRRMQTVADRPKVPDSPRNAMEPMVSDPTRQLEKALTPATTGRNLVNSSLKSRTDIISAPMSLPINQAPNKIKVPEHPSATGQTTMVKNTAFAKVTFSNASSHWAPAPRQSPYWLQQVLGAKQIVLTGTSKKEGSRVNNEQLALARASTIRNFLINQGVPATHIEMRTQLLVSTNSLSEDTEFRQVQIVWNP